MGRRAPTGGLIGGRRTVTLRDGEQLTAIALHERICGVVRSTMLWHSPTCPQSPMYDMMQRILPSPFLDLLLSPLSSFSPPCPSGFVKGDRDFRNWGAGLRNTRVRTSASGSSPRLFVLYLTIRPCALPNHDDSVRHSAATPQHEHFYVMYPVPHRLSSWW